MARKTISDIKHSKGVAPLVWLTAYSARMASLLDRYCDVILVGDSVGMVVYGMSSTIYVTLDMMIAHGKAVVSATKDALVVVDMPFATYHTKNVGFDNAVRVMRETYCDAIKLEGGAEISETVYNIVENGIQVIGHVGLNPQKMKVTGKYEYQGKDEESSQKIITDVNALIDAGVSSIVLECVPLDLADYVTKHSKVPIIGIGASPNCDGQVLVTDDMLGLSGFKPKFVEQLVDFGSEIDRHICVFAERVRNRTFPKAEHCYIKQDKRPS